MSQPDQVDATKLTGEEEREKQENAHLIEVTNEPSPPMTQAEYAEFKAAPEMPIGDSVVGADALAAAGADDAAAAAAEN